MVDTCCVSLLMPPQNSDQLLLNATQTISDRSRIGYLHLGLMRILKRSELEPAPDVPGAVTAKVLGSMRCPRRKLVIAGGWILEGLYPFI